MSESEHVTHETLDRVIELLTRRISAVETDRAWLDGIGRMQQALHERVCALESRGELVPAYPGQATIKENRAAVSRWLRLTEDEQVEYFGERVEGQGGTLDDAIREVQSAEACEHGVRPAAVCAACEEYAARVSEQIDVTEGLRRLERLKRELEVLRRANKDQYALCCAAKIAERDGLRAEVKTLRETRVQIFEIDDVQRTGAEAVAILTERVEELRAEVERLKKLLTVVEEERNDAVERIAQLKDYSAREWKRAQDALAEVERLRKADPFDGVAHEAAAAHLSEIVDRQEEELTQLRERVAWLTDERARDLDAQMEAK